MTDKIQIDPQNDKVIADQSQMSTEELKRFQKSVESEVDQWNEIDHLNNLIKKDK